MVSLFPRSNIREPLIKKKVKSNSDEENSTVGLPPTKQKYLKYTLDTGNAENLVGYELCEIEHSNSGSLPDNDRPISQFYIRSGVKVIGKTIIIRLIGNIKIFDNSISTKKWLSESPLGKHLIGSHQIKGRGRNIQVNIQKDANIEMSSVTQLGDHKVNTWCVYDKDFSVRVISPILPKVDFINTMLPNIIVPNN